MTVRAKYRCLEITRRYTGVQTALLRPVVRMNGKKDPENEEFFRYSPNGKCELTYEGECPLVPGAYYFIDFERHVERGANGEITAMPLAGDMNGELWNLRRRNEEHDTVDVQLVKWNATGKAEGVPFSGMFEVQLSTLASGARAALQPVKSLWSMTITLAEPNDGAG